MMCSTNHAIVDKRSEIQSGQFMMSHLEESESEPEDGESLEESEQASMERSSGMPEFDNLHSLFKCLSVAYIENLTSPRWSHFKGARFALKNKIRLNNIIWREYHMQYVKQLPPIVVQFQVPTYESNHNKNEGIVMEGKFWKRHSKTLCNEYRRWRTFFSNHLRKKRFPLRESCFPDLQLPTDLQHMLFMNDEDNSNNLPNLPDIDDFHLMDDLMMDFGGSLNLFLDQPFPNRRDISMLGNADIIQPGLVQLQPNQEYIFSDLITGLLQQPAMPPISEDGYFPPHQYQEDFSRQPPQQQQPQQSDITYTNLPESQSFKPPPSMNSNFDSLNYVSMPTQTTSSQIAVQQMNKYPCRNQTPLTTCTNNYPYRRPMPSRPTAYVRSSEYSGRDSSVGAFFKCRTTIAQQTEIEQATAAVPRKTPALLNALLQGQPKQNQGQTFASTGIILPSTQQQSPFKKTRGRHLSSPQSNQPVLPASRLTSPNSERNASVSSTLIVDFSKEKMDESQMPDFSKHTATKNFSLSNLEVMETADYLRAPSGPCNDPSACQHNKQLAIALQPNPQQTPQQQSVKEGPLSAPFYQPPDYRSLPNASTTITSDVICSEAGVAPPSPQFTMTANLRHSRPSTNEPQKVVPFFRHTRNAYLHNTVRCSGFYRNAARVQPYTGAMNMSMGSGSSSSSNLGVHSLDQPQLDQSPVKSNGYSSISSAPDFYNICEVPCNHSSFAFNSNVPPIFSKVQFETAYSNETKQDSSLDDYSPSGLDYDENSTEFEEDSKAFSIISDSSATNSKFESRGMSPSSASYLASSNTEQRRRMSMQSSLNTLQELAKEYLGGGGTGGASGSGKRSLNRMGFRSSPNECHKMASNTSSASSTTAGQDCLKTSKAAILRDAATVIETKRAERFRLDSEINKLQAEFESLHMSINACCEKLPVSGTAPKRRISGSGSLDGSSFSQTGEAGQWFRHLVASNSQSNWKFYIYSLIINDLFVSYCDKVCLSSREAFRRSVFNWLDDHASLPRLRPCTIVGNGNVNVLMNSKGFPEYVGFENTLHHEFNKLKEMSLWSICLTVRFRNGCDNVCFPDVSAALCKLSTSTNILEQPNLLPDQARGAAARLAP